MDIKKLLSKSEKDIKIEEIKSQFQNAKDFIFTEDFSKCSFITNQWELIEIYEFRLIPWREIALSTDLISCTELAKIKLTQNQRLSKPIFYDKEGHLWIVSRAVGSRMDEVTVNWNTVFINSGQIKIAKSWDIFFYWYSKNDWKWSQCLYKNWNVILDMWEKYLNSKTFLTVSDNWEHYWINMTYDLRFDDVDKELNIIDGKIIDWYNQIILISDTWEVVTRDIKEELWENLERIYLNWKAELMINTDDARIEKIGIFTNQKSWISNLIAIIKYEEFDELGDPIRKIIVTDPYKEYILPLINERRQFYSKIKVCDNNVYIIWETDKDFLAWDEVDTIFKNWNPIVSDKWISDYQVNEDGSISYQTEYKNDSTKKTRGFILQDWTQLKWDWSWKIFWVRNEWKVEIDELSDKSVVINWKKFNNKIVFKSKLK